LGEPTWNEVAPAEVSFKVVMPDNPQESTAQTGHPGAPPLHRWDSKWGDTIFILSYVEAPKNAVRIASDEAILERGRENTVRDMRGKLVRTKSISLKQVAGIEHEIEINPNLFIRTRSYVTPRREYTLQIIGTPDAVRSGQAQKFLDSFDILKGSP
jgi:hypothetical protein